MTWYAWFIIIEDEVMLKFKKRGALAPETAETRSELGEKSGVIDGECHFLDDE